MTSEYAAADPSGIYYDDGLAHDVRARSEIGDSFGLEQERTLGADKTTAPQEPEGSPQKSTRVLIYTANLGLAVPDPDVAIERARVLAEELDGYVDWIVDASVQLRVPASRWDEALERCRTLGVVISRRIEVRDVGKQLVDLELRLKNQQALLERLRALLDKAEDVKAALEVERELARVQTEVEQIEAQLLKLRQQIAYCTITLTLQRTATNPQARRQLPFPWLHELSLADLLGREVTR